jgi:hypothetical protein
MLFHETYNQMYPECAAAVATQLRDKNLLGFHYIRVGNDPDKRLLTFFAKNLPTYYPGDCGATVSSFSFAPSVLWYIKYV